MSQRLFFTEIRWFHFSEPGTHPRSKSEGAYARGWVDGAYNELAGIPWTERGPVHENGNMNIIPYKVLL